MYRVVINIPKAEDAFYLDKRLTAGPYKNAKEALELFYNNANIFIPRFIFSDNIKINNHWTDGTVEFIYCYDDAYGFPQEFYLGGIESVNDEDYDCYFYMDALE